MWQGMRTTSMSTAHIAMGESSPIARVGLKLGIIILSAVGIPPRSAAPAPCPRPAPSTGSQRPLRVDLEELAL